MRCKLGGSLSLCILIFNGLKYVLSTNHSSSEIDHNLFFLFTLDDSGSYTVNDPSKYTLEKTGLFKNHLEYEFKNGVYCVAVKYEDDVVWATDPETNPVYPKGLKVDPPNLTLWVMFSDSNFATFHFKPSTGTWKFCKDVSSGEGSFYTQTEFPGKLRNFPESHPEHSKGSVPSAATDTPGGTSSVPEASTPRVLELDVGKKQTCTEYEYAKDASVHTFTAKEGYEFNKVKKGNNVLMEPTDGRNYVKVTLDLTDPKKASLEVEYVPQTFVLDFDEEFDSEEKEDHEEKQESEEPVVPETAVDSTPSVPESPVVPQTPVDSTPSVPESPVVPQTPVDSTPAAPESPVVPQTPDTPEESKPLGSPEQSRPGAGDSSDRDKKSYGYGLPRYDYFFNYPKLFTTKSDGTSEELDSTSYYSKDDDELHLLYYKFKRNARCTEVKYNDVTAWKYGEQGFQEYPKALYLHRDILNLVVQFENFYFTYKFKDNKFNYLSTSENSDFSEKDLKIFTFDRFDRSLVNENDQNEYKMVEYYFVTRVFFKSGAQCTGLRYKDKLVWKYDFRCNNFYPMMVSYSQTKRFFVEFNSNWYYVFKQNSVNGEWELERAVE